MAAPPSASQRRHPSEVIEQRFPILYNATRFGEGSGGPNGNTGAVSGWITPSASAGERPGASFVMDHGRVGAQGALGGDDGRPNSLSVQRTDGTIYVPPHLSKDQAVPIKEGDIVAVGTPGGGLRKPA